MTATRTFVGALACALLLTALPQSSFGQDRGGFWIGFGGGYGSANATCDGCGTGDREHGGAGYLKLGWALNDRVLLGGELNVWSKQWRDIEPGLDSRVNMYNAVATVTVYPKASAGFFVKGGAGVALLDNDLTMIGTKVSVDLGRGVGVLAGAGYDIAVARRIVVTPSVNYWYGRLGDVKFGGETLFGNWRQNVVDFTIGITIF